MPRGAQSANAEINRLESVASKRFSQNLYSTGFNLGTRDHTRAVWNAQESVSTGLFRQPAPRSRTLPLSPEESLIRGQSFGGTRLAVSIDPGWIAQTRGIKSSNRPTAFE